MISFFPAENILTRAFDPTSQVYMLVQTCGKFHCLIEISLYRQRTGCLLSLIYIAFCRFFCCKLELVPPSILKQSVMLCYPFLTSFGGSIKPTFSLSIVWTNLLQGSKCTIHILWVFQKRHQFSKLVLNDVISCKLLHPFVFVTVPTSSKTSHSAQLAPVWNTVNGSIPFYFKTIPILKWRCIKNALIAVYPPWSFPIHVKLCIGSLTAIELRKAQLNNCT